MGQMHRGVRTGARESREVPPAVGWGHREKGKAPEIFSRRMDRTW